MYEKKKECDHAQKNFRQINSLVDFFIFGKLVDLRKTFPKSGISEKLLSQNF